MRTIHLVRHGEVHNPDHVVYADLDGFGLSELGWDQAHAAGTYLSDRPVAAIVHSPLQRAVETAGAIAGHHDVATSTDDRLTEWKLGQRWAGIVWEDLPEQRPGELEAYLERPADLPFPAEPLSTVAARFCAAIGAALERHPTGELVFVAHQDPVQAARLALTGGQLHTLQLDKPAHADVITLDTSSAETADPWIESMRWAPDQGRVFPPVDHGAPESDRRYTDRRPHT